MAGTQFIEVAALLEPLERAAVVQGPMEYILIDPMIQHVEDGLA